MYGQIQRLLILNDLWLQVKFIVNELFVSCHWTNDYFHQSTVDKCYGIKEFAQNEYVKENIEFEIFLVKAL